MPVITYRQPDGSTTVIDVPVGHSVMRGAVLNDVDGIVAECGGAGQCGTCHVYVDVDSRPKLPSLHEAEDEVLLGTACPRRENSRLSCQLSVTDELDGLVVDLPEAQI
jgi:2Fe-2S ferredoxin